MRRLAVILALALLVTGCSGSKGDAPGTSASSKPGGAEVQLRVVSDVVARGEPTIAGSPLERCPRVDPPRLDPTKPASACDKDGNRYLLEPASWAGTVKSANASIPFKEMGWVIAIALDEAGTKALATVSKQIAQTEEQLALVIDGEVLSAHQVQAPVSDGRIQISGNFTEASAKALASRLTGR